jgi:homoserine dehydrogenase
LLRVAVVGTGTVGSWVLKAIERQGLDVQVVAIGNRRSGMAVDERGIDVARALARADSLGELPGATHRPTALEAIDEVDADVLLEVSQSPPSHGEPGLSHIRRALERRMAVATSNKWPVALAGVELATLAREQGVGFRAESTVMSGTPLLAALTDGLGGARPLRLRGVLNATVNFMCSRVAAGASYDEALREAQHAGLAERNPSADVSGLDSAAKVMVLSALVFGRQLDPGQVERRGIDSVAPQPGDRLREVAELDPRAGRYSVAAIEVDADDPLHGVDGVMNSVELEVEPLDRISVSGPGAGPELAGQGVFSDLIALSRTVPRRA